MEKTLVIFIGCIVLGIIVVSLMGYMEIQDIEKEAEILGKAFCESKELNYVGGAECSIFTSTDVFCKDESGQIIEYKIACEED